MEKQDFIEDKLVFILNLTIFILLKDKNNISLSNFIVILWI